MWWHELVHRPCHAYAPEFPRRWQRLTNPQETDMTQERAPIREQPLAADEEQTTPWEFVHERLINPERPRTCWLATTHPDGGPHLMPLIAFWIDGALHIVTGEGTRKARDLVADGRCVVGMSSTRLPSIDIVVEGHADRLTDHDAVRRIADALGKNNWPLEAKGDKVYGPNAPTAGPPPYTVFRITPSRMFGFPGMYGMEQTPDDLPKPTRWEFAES
jgi:hypothetical protein